MNFIRHSYKILIMKLIPAIILLLTVCCSAIEARVQDTTLPDDSRDVHVYMWLIDIEEIDSVAQSFIANVVVSLSWRDPGLAHPGGDSIAMKMENIWHPRVQFLNQQRLQQTFPPTAEVRPDGEVIYRQRYWGSFSQPLQLREFPFDKQRLNITLVDAGFGAIDVNFIVSSGSGISDTLKIPDWQVLDWSIDPGHITLGARGEKLDSVTLSIEVERYISFFTLKVILPLILIVAMSWLVFWIDPSLVATQISVSVTAMLTLIAYRFAIGGMVPRLAFLTSLDYFVLGSSIIVFLSLLEVVYSTHLTHMGNLDQARLMDRTARWLVPMMYLLLILETFVLRIGL